MNTTVKTGTRARLAGLWQMTLMALRYLNGRRLRTTLTTLAIVFGIAMIFGMNLLLPGVMDAFSRVMSASTGSADISLGSLSGAAFSAEQPLAEVAKVSGVKAVTGSLRRQITLPTLTDSKLGETAQIELVGIEPASGTAVRNYLTSEGRFLEVGDTGKAVIPAGLAELAPQIKIGTTFPLITTGGLKLLTVVGFLAERGGSTPTIYVTLPDAQQMLNQPGLINVIDVAVTPGADRDSVAASVLAALGSAYQVSGSTAQTDMLGSAQVGYAIFNMLGLMALFLGAFLIFNTFRTVVVERRRDLAVLRAVGAERRQLTQMILIESLIQGVVGTLLGMFVGLLLVSGMAALLNSAYSQFFRGMRFDTIVVTPGSVISALALGLLTALLAGYWPARTAGKTSPLDGLRPATNQNVRRAARWSLIIGAVVMLLAVVMLMAGSRTAAAGTIVFLVGMVIAAPGLVMPLARLLSPLLALWFNREGDLARSNVTRNPGRAAITASTLMIGLATFVLIGATISGFGYLLKDLFTANFSSDVMLMPPSIGVYNSVVGADASLSTALAKLPQVDTVASLRSATSTYNGQPLEVLGIDPVAYPKIAPLDFQQGDPASVYSALGSGRNLIATSLTVNTFKLKVGDTVSIATAEGPQTYTLVGVADDLFTFKLNVFFVSQANIQADFHKVEDVLLMLKFVPGTDTATALAEVQKVAADYPQFTVRRTGEYRAELQNAVDVGMSAFYVVGLMILFPAALGLINTMTINVLERTREIGVLRAVGGSRKQIRRMVTAEALLLGLFGASTGVLAGLAMGYGFTAAFGAIGWTMPFEFPLIGVIAAIVMGVLVAMIAAILPARNAARLDIVRALQYE